MTIDEQIANVERAIAACEKGGFPPYDLRAILASLERLKAIDNAEVPEPRLFDHAREQTK